MSTRNGPHDPRLPPDEYWLDFTVSLVTHEEPSYILTENLRAKIEEELRVWKHDPTIVVSIRGSRKVDKMDTQEATGGK